MESKIKSVRTFLKMCIAICETDRLELKGINKLSEKEFNLLGQIRAGIQNDLGENTEFLQKFNHKAEW